MKKRNFFLTLTLALTLAQPVFAAESHDMGGGQTMSGHNMGDHKMGAMDQASGMGEKIHESKVEGYQLTYQLIDNLKQLEAAKKAGKAKDVDLGKVKSNHLMVYIKSADGGKIENAKVGYLVKGPDGVEQTVMTMFMEGGYGADIELKTPGAYTIKSKSALNGKNLLDEFTYTKK